MRWCTAIAPGVALLAACQWQDPPPPPALASVAPARVLALREVGLTIRGNFPVGISLDLTDRDASQLDTFYFASLSGQALHDVTLLDSATLTARLPAVLTAGAYDLELRGPTGLATPLRQAVLVVNCLDDEGCTDACHGLATVTCDSSGTCQRGAADRDRDRDGQVAWFCGGEDCDDERELIWLGAPELCDGLDNDCDGLTDEEPECACGGVRPPEPEACGNARDDDCDGQTDEGCLRPSNVPAAWLCADGATFAPGIDTLVDTDAGTIAGSAAGLTVNRIEQGPGLPGLTAFSFGAIEIPAGVTVRAIGRRALALLACGPATIAGRIDLRGRGGFLRGDETWSAGRGGPGGFDGGSLLGEVAPFNDPGGAGPGGGAGGVEGDAGCAVVDSGGNGGSHAAFGGRGGDGSSLACQALTPVPAAPYGASSLVPLVGGSGGGAGGDNWGGPGGGGGGALQLSAGGALTIAAGGGIDCGGGGGAGGHDGADSSAGGGGGAGGALLLEAPLVTVAGRLTANGGAGGAGYRVDSSFGNQVAPAGQDASSDDTLAAGGAGSGIGGSGGYGAAGDLGAGGTGATAINGGGGGGAVGRIRINTADGDSLLLSGGWLISPSAASGAFTQGGADLGRRRESVGP